MSKKRKIFFILCISFFIAICLFIILFIFSIKKDKEATTKQMSEVVEEYSKFSQSIDTFNEIRNQLYLDVFENTYYENLSENDPQFKERFLAYEKVVDSIILSAEGLDRMCTGVYYVDSKVNAKCSEFGSVYEQIVNAFVSDVDLYNNNIKKYNNYQKENNGTLYLDSYVTKKKYFDYNKDKVYEGKEDVQDE